MRRLSERGFTLVEVLVALVIVAMGLAALMTAVSGTANASGYLRDKAVSQWIALNRLAEVRLHLQKSVESTDTGELDFAGRKWHYDTQYFSTSFPSMKRVVVHVYAGAADLKGNPLNETTGFVGTALTPAGSSNIDWTAGSTVPPPNQNGQAGTTGAATGTNNGTGSGTNPATGTNTGNGTGAGSGTNTGTGTGSGTTTGGGTTTPNSGVTPVP